jgi:hypothetical protein
VSSAADRAYVLRLHDSVRAAVSRGATNRPVIDRAITGEARASLEHMVREATRFRARDPRVRVDIAVVLDTVRTERGHPRSGFQGAMTFDYLLPQADGDRCIVVARVKLSRSLALTSSTAQGRMLGPCAFYESFGPPGPVLDQWLRKRGWALGAYTSLNGEPDAGWRAPRIWPHGDRDLRWYMAEEGFACLTGRDSSCAVAIAHGSQTSRYERRPLIIDGALRTARLDMSHYGMWYTREFAFGPRGPSLLSDMALSIGHERFGRFWVSTAPPSDAFRAATGQELTDWTQAWLARSYFRQEAGPMLEGSSLLIGLAIILSGAAIATAVSRRRQIA